MENWQRNIDTVSRGGGSEQARHRDCPTCNDHDELSELIDDGICPFCRTKVDHALLTSEKDVKEYRISGLCFRCQQGVFDKIE